MNLNYQHRGHRGRVSMRGCVSDKFLDLLKMGRNECFPKDMVCGTFQNLTAKDLDNLWIEIRTAWDNVKLVETISAGTLSGNSTHPQPHLTDCYRNDKESSFCTCNIYDYCDGATEDPKHRITRNSSYGTTKKPGNRDASPMENGTTENSLNVTTEKTTFRANDLRKSRATKPPLNGSDNSKDKRTTKTPTENGVTTTPQNESQDPASNGDTKISLSFLSLLFMIILMAILLLS